MTSDRLNRKIEEISAQIADLQAKLQDLVNQKEAADFAAGKAILQKKKITPDELKFLISLSEEEKALILNRRKVSDSPAPDPGPATVTP